MSWAAHRGMLSSVAVLAPVTISLVDVIIVAGQSNAAGYPSDTSLSYTPDTSVKCWNGSAWVTYAPNTITGYEELAPAGKWSAEMQFSRDFRTANPTKELRIIKFTYQGTFLHVNDSGPDWAPTSTGELFDQAAAFIANALTALTSEGKTANIRFVWWMQGEADGSNGSTISADYQTNLTNFITAIRSGWGITATTRIIVGRIANQATSDWRVVRGAQVAVAEADPYVYWQDTDYAAFTLPHYENSGLIDIGANLYTLDSTIGSTMSTPAWVNALDVNDTVIDFSQNLVWEGDNKRTRPLSEYFTFISGVSYSFAAPALARYRNPQVTTIIALNSASGSAGARLIGWAAAGSDTELFYFSDIQVGTYSTDPSPVQLNVTLGGAHTFAAGVTVGVALDTQSTNRTHGGGGASGNLTTNRPLQSAYYLGGNPASGDAIASASWAQVVFKMRRLSGTDLNTRTA